MQGSDLGDFLIRDAGAGELPRERFQGSHDREHLLDVAEIRALHYQMVLHYTRRELPEYFRLNQRIHERILEIAGNATLSRTYAGLAGRVRRARYIANMTQSRWGRAVEEHETILDALAQRDGPRLARILKMHLQNKCETVKESLEAEGRGDTY